MNVQGVAGLKIVAPINSPDAVELLHAAGAAELYCGILPQTWTDVYGFSDMLNKRQGPIANLTSFRALRLLLARAHQFAMPVALTLNIAYTADMLPAVLEIADVWANAGGDALMVSDIALLLAMQDRRPEMRRCLSILGNPFNSGVLRFYRRFGISRAVLPRELTIAEMGEIVRRCPDLEYEVMAFNDKCYFIDGHCNFYHSTRFAANQATAFPFVSRGGQSEIACFDPGYSGHGCSLLRPYARATGDARAATGNSGCAACYLERLAAAGIDFLKLGGRGLPPEKNAQNVRFLGGVIAMLSHGGASSEAVRGFFHETYGHPCESGSCYYADAQVR
jgi:collagenase-like PrtC family protease